jgi:hypothetical protein
VGIIVPSILELIGHAHSQHEKEEANRNAQRDPEALRRTSSCNSN